MAKTTTEKPDLLAALAAAGEEDLTKVNERIAALKRELAGLEEAARLLERRLHGKPAKKARQSGKPGSGDGS